MTRLTERQIEDKLRELKGWKRKGRHIEKTYRFKSFPEAIDFVNMVAKHAEEAYHHPDISIRYTRVTLALTTHDAGGLTGKDFSLAGKIEAALST